MKREEECAREDFYTGMMTKWNAVAASVCVHVLVHIYIFAFLFMVNRSRVFVSAAKGARARARPSLESTPLTTRRKFGIPTTR